jgi:hypothetical protein
VRLNQSRYKLECECGYRKTVMAGDIGEHGLLTWRWECPKCKTLHYHYMRSDTTRLHEATLDLQFEILDVFADIAPPLTVRQMYYQLTTRKAVDKTEAGYNRVQRELTKMRRAGTIPYGWLADNSRTFYEAETHRSLQEAAADMARWYRRALRAAEETAIDHAARRLVGLQDDAIALLGDVVADRAAAPGVRVRAAALIIDLSLRLRELRSLEERVTALERGNRGQG